MPIGPSPQAEWRFGVLLGPGQYGFDMRVADGFAMKVLVTAPRSMAAARRSEETSLLCWPRAALEADFGRPDEVESLDDYDAVVVRSAVYVGGWVASAAQFIDRHRAALGKKPVWLFSSGPLGNPPRPAEVPLDAARLAEQVGARGHRVFSGKLDRARLGLAERATVKLVRAPYGDFREWPEIESWAGEIAAALTRGEGGQR